MISLISLLLCQCQHSVLSPVFTSILILFIPHPHPHHPSSCHYRETEEKVRRDWSLHYTVSRFILLAGCQNSFKNSILRLPQHNTVNPISCLVSWLPSTKYITRPLQYIIYIAEILSFILDGFMISKIIHLTRLPISFNFNSRNGAQTCKT